VTTIRTKTSTERPEKILLAMYALSGGESRPLRYEDIVVKAFELFPDEFALRGHPQYPDSSDIHKPLYGPLKRSGLVRAANKTFALTPRGLEMAGGLRRGDGKPDPNRMTRDAEVLLVRMMQSDAYRLFGQAKGERLVDTDLYAFLGCTVRTPRNDFIGTLTVSREAVELAARLGKPDKGTALQLKRLWEFLQIHFRDLILSRTHPAK
jgi:hypothetical protein